MSPGYAAEKKAIVTMAQVSLESVAIRYASDETTGP